MNNIADKIIWHTPNTEPEKKLNNTYIYERIWNKISDPLISNDSMGAVVAIQRGVYE